MPLSWSCLCGGGHVHHVWETLRCPRCGAGRDGMVRAEREKRIEATLSPAERAKLERLHGRWVKGECD